MLIKVGVPTFSQYYNRSLYMSKTVTEHIGSISWQCFNDYHVIDLSKFDLVHP